MKKKDFVIGVLGGMGTYATINMFKQYADIFAAEKEWDRPRIIIDNRCTMPSRVRAAIYNENVEQLVEQMSDSLESLISLGGDYTKVILACNTSHIFLPLIYKRNPQIEQNIVSIINQCVEEIKDDKIKNVYLLASEGTIQLEIYQKELSVYGINCIVPENKEYGLLRECIEAVKQNKYSKEIEEIFLELVNRYDNCILGCTELPILYEKYKQKIQVKVYDPILITIKYLKKEFDSYE